MGGWAMVLAAVVVLYRPDKERFLQSIQSYATGMDFVFVMDNSENPDSTLLEELSRFSNVRYQAFGENKGLSKAMNRGVRLALEQKADWILLMNQDSVFPENPLPEYRKWMKEDVSLLAPKYSTFKKKEEKGEGVSRLSFAQTSGSFLSKKCFEEIGFFDENLFLEWVDVDYCLRLEKAGKKLLQVNSVVLDHLPGTPRKVRVLWKEVQYSRYSPLRKYYLVRGACYMRKKFHCPSLYLKMRIKLWIKMYVFREKDLIISRRYIRQAKIDFRKGIRGPLKNPPSIRSKH